MSLKTEDFVLCFFYILLLHAGGDIDIMKKVSIIHPLQPIYSSSSRVLILGTMPSPKSRQNGFYYGHPQNRFWRVLAAVLREPVPVSIEEKKHLLLVHDIALWDVLHACSIHGADDSTIGNPVANPISTLLQRTCVQNIFTTGRKAYSLYEKLVYMQTGIHAVYLPSTSPANCRMTMEQLVQAYSCIIEKIEIKGDKNNDG